jgi:hypothetical protein
MRFSSAPLVAFVLVAAASSGCTHITSTLPGVLDLRSDGSEAPPNTDSIPLSDATREGVGGFFLGTGATGSGDVKIENRETFLGLGLIFIHPLNGDVDDEWNAVLGKDGAARNVSVGEQLSIMGWASEMVRGFCCIPIFPFWALSVDVTGKATRIKAVSGARDEPTMPAFPAPGTATPTDGKY